jgi:hypothetical protein
MEETKTEINNEFEEESRELTTYSYISNYLHFEYFVGYEIASLLGYANPTKVITNNVSKSNQLVFRYYPGVKIPELDPRTILITAEGAIEILIKCRKIISPDVLHILKKFNIDTTNKKCLTKEQQNLNAITNVFKTEKFEDQYKVGKYFLDLYFPEYQIVIEVDENGHRDRRPSDERERMDFVNAELGIDDSHWIRFNPDEYDFDITKVIGQILRKMKESKDIIRYIKIFEKTEKTEDTVEEKKEKILNDIKSAYKSELIQYEKNFDGYIIDVYFPHYNLYVIYEENFDEDCIEYINKKFETTENNWVIMNLNEDNYSSKIIVEICEKILIMKDKKGEELISFTKENLEIEPITGKYKAPPKKFLEQRLQNGDSMLKIGQLLGISSKPVVKWLKEYNLKLPDNKIPEKKELIQLFQTKNQTEVAEHYNISTHTVRKWLKKYDLDLAKIKNEIEINKKDVVMLINEGKNYQEIADELCVPELKIMKYIKMNNIEKIPPKKDLEEMINKKSRDEIAEFYKTTRATLRKWLQLYDLDDIKRSSTKIRVRVVSTDNIIVEYDSIVETCKELKMSHNKLEEVADTDELYIGRKFYFIRSNH